MLGKHSLIEVAEHSGILPVLKTNLFEESTVTKITTTSSKNRICNQFPIESSMVI